MENSFLISIILTLVIGLSIPSFLLLFQKLSHDYKILDIYEFPASETTKIPIKKLILYPVRGIKGIEVDKLFMTNSGALFDREWIIVRTEDGKHRSLSSTPEMTRFRQRLEYDQKDDVVPKTLVISIANGFCTEIKVREMRIEVERKYDERDFYSARKPNGATFQYQGYKESDEVN